ncbi:MAG: phenylalanine--tRNA ligase subunit alpha, partial [Kerstersia sp.]
MTTMVEDLIAQARELFAQAADAAALENAKARFLGKQGALTAQMKALAQLAPEEKR